MKRSLALGLQVAVVLLGVVTLFLLLWEPHLEGRNAQATPFEVYFHDPFLAYVYAGSIAYFVGLSRAFRLLGQVRLTGAYSSATVASLQTIRRCAIILLGFVAGGVVFVVLAGDQEDRPAGFMMCLLVALATGAVATIAGWWARRLQVTLSLPAGGGAE